MSNTLAHAGVTITLPEGLWWADENAWQPVHQSITRSVTGKPLIQWRQYTAGRLVTLEPAPGLNVGWWTRAEHDVLDGWACIAGAVLTLTWNGVQYPCRFRYDQGRAVSLEPMWPGHADDPTDYVRPRIQLITVEA